MTTRIGQPDTRADLELRACLDETPVRSFVMVAGAGSGKTTSLVKALDHLARTRGVALRRRGQQIACITYTEVAVGEIWGDVGNSTLFHVSTIHSFLWSVVSPFQTDLKAWVKDRIAEKIATSDEKIGRPLTRQATREKEARKIERYRRQLEVIDAVPKFTYGPGANYAKGVLGHDDILKIGPELIGRHALLRTLVAGRFPFVFVDESQDTSPTVVEALKRIEAEVEIEFCVGFFGDPMQKIYTTGAGAIALVDGWNEIKKPENFRCPQSVLAFVNQIRSEDDGLRQIRGRTVLRNGVAEPVQGTARIFVLPADRERAARLEQVRGWLAAAAGDDLWLRNDPDSNVRSLVLVHRMAAVRLGFAGLYAALNDRAPVDFKEGLKDGKAWPLRPFINFILPIVLASRAERSSEVIAHLRANCPLLTAERLTSENAVGVLAGLHAAVVRLTGLLADESVATVGDIISLVGETELAELDPRFAPNPEAEADMGDDNEEESDASERHAVSAFLACPAPELWGYRAYLEEESPFATQQGIKGAEFERVLVVIDDEEANYSLFSYGKYFGFADLSDKDEENIANGVDSVLDRTRRLFYVCASRAREDLAVVVFAPDPNGARNAILAKNLVPPAQLFGIEDL
ncbi:DNA helicase-2/ATP-dependent DNA helicase PcrA [Caulobacter ginsengisoli]|uniref:DNA helicase-2/ATP-dependent DNA helicase PcrA n=1 Tax=Caulobacter ginsengisoli TaxID=400775 RepID=A0ABU0ILQ2_9CAUL|nr:UvrD-helicase domain-containing protein [Caulobacter ginsengisoli]MDQ0462939.1 DNA helicase-2/ATP-dependent DNA helicase PcrA [Caulobacter ginsengisoli]